MATAVVVEGVRVLGERDAVLARLAERHGPPTFRRRSTPGERFEALVRSIVYQQLAGKAAAAIHGRLIVGLGGSISPERILERSPDELRLFGLSGAKESAVRDLAEKVAAGQVSLNRIGRMQDEAVVEHLVQVRGIGEWTAHMFLIATLGRLDVWPTGDFGVRAGYAAAWSTTSVPTPKELAALGDRFRPYRSLVAWYCWRAADEAKQGAAGRIPAIPAIPAARR